MQGEVLPGGSDTFLVRPDGVGTLDVRATLKTADGTLIYVTYQGCMQHIPSLEAKLINGESVPWSDYYFRVAPLYETASEQYAWLNQIVAIGVGEADLGGVS